MECELLFFVKNHIPYLWGLSNSFSHSFIYFYSCEGFHQVIDQEERSIKFRVKNGGWHESLNLLHVSTCEMLHFVTSYMKQNKSRKQTLESAQYGLEISFNLTAELIFTPKMPFLTVKPVIWLPRCWMSLSFDEEAISYETDRFPED